MLLWMIFVTTILMAIVTIKTNIQYDGGEQTGIKIELKSKVQMF
jgi:hypothetical protein